MWLSGKGLDSAGNLRVALRVDMASPECLFRWERGLRGEERWYSGGGR